uniref:Uncharacterized protein n=1 Tax=Romanomermis culicivorax TaxID=13658 RepID=A0A915IJE8_ROMCU
MAKADFGSHRSTRRETYQIAGFFRESRRTRVAQWLANLQEPFWFMECGIPGAAVRIVPVVRHTGHNLGQRPC